MKTGPFTGLGYSRNKKRMLKSIARRQLAMADLFMDDDAAKWKRRRRCYCLRQDGPVFGLVPEEEAELVRLDAEFGPDLSKEFPDAEP